MSQKIRAVQVGCGPIGCAVAKLAMEHSDIELVGAVDIDKKKVGKDLGEIIGNKQKIGVIVSDNLEEVFGKAKANVAFHQTGSFLKSVAPQLIKLMSFGLNIVSTTEELAYPFLKHPDIANQLDQIAKTQKVTILGTGINPGFVMDTWPLALTAVCQVVKKVKVVRVQDARPRRLPFQKKIGAGCTLEEFQGLVEAGTLKHMGLSESIAMVAAGLGWKLNKITEDIEPIIAEKKVQSQYTTVLPGQVSGVKQVGRGFRDGEEVITHIFEASLGASNSFDAVYITGTPDLEAVINGGIHGDIATAAIVVNAAPRIVEAAPGLITMKDLPLVVCSASTS